MQLQSSIYLLIVSDLLSLQTPLAYIIRSVFTGSKRLPSKLEKTVLLQLS